MPPAREQRRIASFFEDICHNYEKFSNLYSLSLFTRWRERLMDEIALPECGSALDIATGTGENLRMLGDLARSRGRELDVFGIDITRGMVSFADSGPQITLSRAEDLPFRDETFDISLCSYALRHFYQERVFSQLYRVLKPGGGVYLLDIKEPGNALVNKGYRTYLSRIVPLIMRFRHGRSDGREAIEAVDFLVDSLDYSPNTDIPEKLERAGFENVRTTPLTMDTAFIAKGEKPA
ncbi:MAG: Ubiquinone/menaquinone biosynthesis C-methyltransferase UbiE [Methanonatronarchaeales archaeon]|nr:Ubiquinone/menaquinone biosynthesis C-methyltransferase UbiE [Methanonatronarchaeales archaeon]